MSKKTQIDTGHKPISGKGFKLEILERIGKEMQQSEKSNTILYDEFLFIASQKPAMIFRDIFQLFHDMVNHHIPEGFDEYPLTRDSAGFLNYDTNGLFVEHLDEPFFADRIFANRFMALAKSFGSGVQNNQIYLFEGPPGSGKSTFLNNLILKFEEFSKTLKGGIYKITWKIPLEDLPANKLSKIQGITPSSSISLSTQDTFSISCPNNDHPILIFPKKQRKRLIEELVQDKNLKQQIFNNLEYEWVLQQNACTFCSSLYDQLLEIYKDPVKVLRCVHPKRMEFSRNFGKGISVFNPGDPLLLGPIDTKETQQTISSLFKTDEISYLHSYLAYTNNGMLALMDIKENNKTRLMNLHGIISDGVHKVGHVEEKIKTLFIGVINPEDTSTYENIHSFKDRITTIQIPYVLDYNTEVSIYLNKFGNHVTEMFYPRTLINFAKIIVGTRMLTDTAIFDQWLKQPALYKSYIDQHLLLLKMELYCGKIPKWLLEEDVAGFNKQIRKRIIENTENEGKFGVSGRQSLNIFSNLISKFNQKKQSITMSHIIDFVKNNSMFHSVPSGFVDALNNLYDFNILEEVKESLYFYNEAKMKRDIKNYLFALNYEPGEKVVSHYTGDHIDVSDDFYRLTEQYIWGNEIDDTQRANLRKEEHHLYITRTLAQEIRMQDKNIEQTEQFISLLRKYTDILKQFALTPYENNDHFKRAIEAYDTSSFNKFEAPLKKNINRLIQNMVSKFGYSEESAKNTILFVLENKFNERFKNFGI